MHSVVHINRRSMSGELGASENVFDFSGGGKSLRFQPYAKSEFVNELTRAGWKLSHFQLDNTGQNFAFTGRVNVPSSRSAYWVQSELTGYFGRYFSGVRLTAYPISLGTGATPAASQAPALGGRYLDIVGTADVVPGLLSQTTLTAALKNAFVSHGWQVSSVDLDSYSTSGYRFRISVWVSDRHGDSEVLSSGKAAILAVRNGAFQTFSNVSASLEQGSSTAGANTGGASSIGNLFSGSGGSDFLGSLGLGLGVSTPVIIGIGLVALLVIKKL